MLQRALLLLFVFAGMADAAIDVDFAADVGPILESHCLRCHSTGISKGDLSLATIDDLRDNQYIVPGKPDQSVLVEVITSHGGEPPRMPVEGDPLSKTEIATIRKWISGGAVWPKEIVLREKSKADTSWWSLQPLREQRKPSDPETIDWFVDRRLKANGLERNEPADRKDLIRRATYDLIGLPPTPEQVAAFVAGEETYEQLIDRLLASQHYGQRWGRHWLDVVRFGESNGFERNVIINDLWPFRDYVIQSINDNKPFDQFIREHIAGDAIGKDQPDIEVGSAFLVAGPYDNVGNSDAVQAAQIRADTIDEMIRSTSEAFLGLTIGCARCHDHKFDPILQSDYYSMYATFAGVRHGSRQLGTAEAKAERGTKLKPLQTRKAELEKQRQQVDAAIIGRAKAKLAEYEGKWLRPKPNRMGTEERFEPVKAQFVRLVCDAQDSNPLSRQFRIDEFEVSSADSNPTNVALASNGGKSQRGGSKDSGLSGSLRC